MSRTDSDQKATAREASPDSGIYHPGTWLLMGLVAAEVALIAVLPHFPTSDGPEHLATGAVLGGWNGLHHDLYAQYFTRDFFPAPNLTADLALTALQLILPPVAALKVLLIAYVIALPAALAYAVRGIHANSGWLTFFALPVTFCWALSQGLIDFLFGLVLFLVVVGYAWRSGVQHGSLTVRQTVVLAGLLLATYLTHLVPFVQALLFVVVAALAGTTSALQSRRGEASSGRLLARGLLPVGLAVLPGVVLGAVFSLSSADLPTGEPIPLTRTLLLLGTLLHAIYTFSASELVFSILLSLSLLVLVVTAVRSRLRTRERQPGDLFAVLVLLDVGPFLVLPDVVRGASDVHARLTVLIILLVVLWLAAHSWTPRAALGGAVAATAVTVGLVGFRLPALTYFSSQIAAWQSLAPCIPPGSTMVEAALANDEPYGQMRVSPLRYAVGYIAAGRGGVDLGNITNSLPFFLVQYRPETDPFRHLSTDGQFGLDTTPSQLDLEKYARTTPGRVDFVFVYGRGLAGPEVLAAENTARLDAALGAGYTLVAPATPDGFVEVHQRNDTADVAAVSACMTRRDR